ncbi:hypothetical protein [Streptomyces rubellomurinus]|uniref:Haloacid dehalogenase n=1 Tax=Streptomyces rubellomurinus (strain ATCC 31215) TaxID=359131 RepID=A0A0F2TLK6_STRR3|nr:hypothetical protein [Streptomyces rubellomurinus]KJS63165.1 hypothetical protein VM95_04185 [Streptomyces rubellomurinus]
MTDDRNSGPTPFALWTDCTGVLTQSAAELLRAFADRVGAPGHALREAMAQVSGEHGGTLPPDAGAAWSAAVEAVLEHEYGVVCDLSRAQEIWLDLCRPNRAWIDRLAQLRTEGVFVGLLTDLPDGREPGWLRLLAPLLFDAVVRRSSAAGAGLPLRAAQAAAGRSAARCVLVDASEVRGARARAAGWRTIAFRDTASALAEVGRLLDTEDIGAEDIGSEHIDTEAIDTEAIAVPA